MNGSSPGGRGVTAGPRAPAPRRRLLRLPSALLRVVPVLPVLLLLPATLLSVLPVQTTLLTDSGDDGAPVPPGPSVDRARAAPFAAMGALPGSSHPGAPGPGTPDPGAAGPGTLDPDVAARRTAAQSAPTQSAPAQSAPAQSAPAQSAPARSGLDRARWIWPTGVPVVLRPWEQPTGEYGPGHRGIDVPGTVGTDVFAVEEGVVAFAGSIGGRGVVTIDHGGGLVSTLDSVTPSVHQGDRVRQGDVVGSVAVGHCAAEEPCLHLGARQDDRYVDPTPFLSAAEWPVLLPWP